MRKNFIAHRGRNQKTTLLYSIALGFIVFISVSYTLQLNTFLYRIRQENGCYLKVYSNDVFKRDDIYALESVALKNPDIIEKFGWVAHHITKVNGMHEATISNIGRYKSDKDIRVKGVSPNLFETTLNEFLIIDEIDSDQTVSESLYTIQGSHSIVLGSYYKELLAAEMGDQFLIDFAWTLKSDQIYSFANAPTPTFLPSALKNQSHFLRFNTTNDDRTEGITTSRLTPIAYLESCIHFTFFENTKLY